MATRSPFSNLFGRSPFKALQEHIRVAVKCACLVPDQIDALCAGNNAQVVKIQKAIFSLESEADDLKNELRGHLPKSLFMPVDRRDLLEVLDFQDSIADSAKHVARLLVERNMEVPDSMKEPLKALSRRCADACVQCQKVIEELDELVETGFGGRESVRVSQMLDELNRIETDTDRMASDLSRELFALEESMSPVSVILLYQQIKQIGNLADFAEKVGNRLRLLLAR